MIAADSRSARVPAAHGHLVQVYADPAELCSAVTRHLAAGFDAGEPALVVAASAHWSLFAEALRGRGWDVDALEARGELLVLDAEETLARILVSDGPSARRFDDVVGGALAAVEPSGERPVRVYGEMVDLLWQRGDTAAAGALEDLWNRLAGRRRFSLLCGYGIDVFDREAQVAVLPMVCATHSRVAPAADPERLDAAVEVALAEALGPRDAERVYALAAGQERPGAISPGQVALMWVSAHMPRSAERVLAAARVRYRAA